MSRIQPHNDPIIDISDSDDDQALARPIQPKTCRFVAGNKRPNVPWQAPVAVSRVAAAVPSPAKPVVHVDLGSVPSNWTPVSGASSNQWAAIARKPLMNAIDPVDLTLSSDEDETATPPPSSPTRSTNPAPRLQPRFIRSDAPSPPPSATAPLPTQKDPSQKTISSPAASPGLGVILVPGRKKRKRQIGGYQPGLLGFNADHVDSTPNPVDPNPDLPTRKRARISISGAKLLPVPAEKICIRGLEGLLKKPARDEISKGAPNTGPRISEKGNKVKGLRNKARNKAGAPAKLKRSYLPPCEEPEKVDVVITPTDIANVLRTVTSDNEADQTCMDIEVDMSGEPPPRGRSPTPVQHPQTPQTPPLAMGELDASNRPSQRTESTQEVINVFDFDLNLGWDEEHDADLQRALQLDCEMHSSPTRPTVCTPSIIELDDAIDFNSGPSGDYPCNLPYGGVPGVGYSWECHDLAPFATEAATFTGVYLHGPSKKTSDVCEANGVSEEQVQGPFAPDVVDLYRQTIEDQLRVWTENPRTGISPNIVDELEVLNEELAMRVEKRKLAEGTTGVSRPHEKSDIQKFIELNLKPIPSLLEGEEAVVPESPDVVQQTTPGGRFITQVTVASPSRVGLIGSNRLSTSHGAFAIVDSEIRASDEGVGTNRRPSLFAAKPEPQEPILPQSPAPRGIRISITGSKSAEPTAPSKRTVPASRVTRSQSSKKSSKPTIEELERIMLKRLNLTPKALASHNPPVWEGLAPLRPKKLYLSANEITQWEREQEPGGAERDFTTFTMS